MDLSKLMLNFEAYAIVAGITCVCAAVIILIIGLILKGTRTVYYHPGTGQRIEAKSGFSFTYYFFGPFVPLFRGHISGALLTLIIELVTCSLARFVLAFVYNGMYIKWLLKKGFAEEGGFQQLQQPAQGLPNQANGKEWTNSVSFHPSLPDDGFNRSGYFDTQEVFQPAGGGDFHYEEEDDSDTVAMSGGCIQGLDGQYQGAEILMKMEETVLIGRDGSKCNLVIDDKSVSRRHCSIRYDSFDRRYIVKDMSSYGVFTDNNEQLPSGQDVILPSGTRIRLGATKNLFLLK